MDADQREWMYRSFSNEQLATLGRRVLPIDEQDLATLLEVRDRWPRGIPLAVWPRNIDVGFGGKRRVISLSPQFAGGQRVSILTTRSDFWPDGNVGYGPLGRALRIGTPIDRGPYTVDIRLADVSSFKAFQNQTDLGATLLEAQGTIAFELVDSVDDVLTPVQNESVTQAIQQGLKLEWRDSRGASLYADWRPSATLLPNMAIAGVIEFRHQDEVIAETVFNLRASSETRFGYLKGDHAKLRVAGVSYADWQVRVRGVGEIALYDRDATSYWAGEITVPLSDIDGVEPRTSRSNTPRYPVQNTLNGRSD